MYDRQQEDEVLTLFGSGDIWQRALVLKDQSSGSLWSQMLGKAMQGQREGQALQVIPTVLTDWKTWKQSHPLTTVMALPPMTRFYDNKYYQGRLGRFLIAMREAEQQPRAWRFDQLTHQPVLNDQFAGKPIVEVMQTADSSLTAAMGRMSAYSGREVDWRFMTEKSELDTFKHDLALHQSIESPGYAVPGEWKLS